MDEKTESIARNFKQLLPKENDAIDAVSYEELNLSVVNRKLYIPGNSLRYRYEKGTVYLRNAITEDRGMEKLTWLES